MSNKTRKKQLKQLQNQAQEGRSMVEMLGVLAIIGVLSLGGIAGYRMAMNRYQANQIANEINLMRTDAKMKVARGVELLLGEPYDGDDGHLNFGSNYGVKVASKDIVDGETTEKGYSFTLSNIPEGVCKPLVALLDNMDDTADITIDGKSYYDENASEDFCGETNEVMVAFSTKDIGSVGSGSGNPEVTEPEQGDEPTTCDPETCLGGECQDDGTCQCPENKNWTGTDCITCPTGTTWNDTKKECTCSDGKHLYGNQCVTCDTSTGGTWDEENKECKCKEEGKYWSDSAGECIDNPCNKNGQGCAADEFCRSSSCSSTCRNSQITEDSCLTYKCEKIDSYKAENKDSEHPDKYVMSKGENLNWWSAERFCEALNKHMVAISELQCRHNIQYSGGDCQYGYCHASDTEQECEIQNKRAGESYYGDVSEVIKELRKAENGTETKGNHDYWLYNAYVNTNTTSSRDSCNAYRVPLINGRVDYFARSGNAYALCE